MAEGSTHDSDEEEGEDGEDGDDDDEGSVENQSSPSKPPRPLSSPPSSLTVSTEISDIPLPDMEMGGSEATARPSIPHLEREKLELKAGSPLKNVALTTSTLTSPLESPSTIAAPPFLDSAPITELNPISEAAEPAEVDETTQQIMTETAPTELQPLTSELALVEEVAGPEALQEEDEMLLDIAGNANNAAIGGDESLSTGAPEMSIELPLEIREVASESVLADLAEVPGEQAEVPVETAGLEDVQAELPQPAEEDDDDFPDLLGGLEKQLNEQVSQVPEVEPVAEVLAEKATSVANDEEKEVLEEGTSEP
jgi:hypothetical protein